MIAERNAINSRTMLRPTTTAMISGSRFPIRSARSSCCAVEPPTLASAPGAGMVWRRAPRRRDDLVAHLVAQCAGHIRRRRAGRDHVDQGGGAVLGHLRGADGLD